MIMQVSDSTVSLSLSQNELFDNQEKPHGDTILGSNVDPKVKKYGQAWSNTIQNLILLFRRPSSVIMEPNPFTDCPKEAKSNLKSWEELLDIVFDLSPDKIEVFEKSFPKKILLLTSPDRGRLDARWSVRLNDVNASDYFRKTYQKARATLTHDLTILNELHADISMCLKEVGGLTRLPSLTSYQAKSKVSFEKVLAHLRNDVNRHLDTLQSSNNSEESALDTDDEENQVLNMCMKHRNLVMEYASQELLRAGWKPPEKNNAVGIDNTPIHGPKSTCSPIPKKKKRKRRPSTNLNSMKVQGRKTTHSRTSTKRCKQSTTDKNLGSKHRIKCTQGTGSNIMLFRNSETENMSDTNSDSTPAQSPESIHLCTSVKCRKPCTHNMDPNSTPLQIQESPRLRTSKEHSKKPMQGTDYQSSPAQNLVSAHLCTPDGKKNMYRLGLLTFYLTVKGKACIGCTYPDGRTSQVNIREKERAMFFTVKETPKNVLCEGSLQPIYFPVDDADYPPLSSNTHFFLKPDSTIYVQRCNTERSAYTQVSYFTQDFILRMCNTIKTLSIWSKFRQEVKKVNTKGPAEKCRVVNTGDCDRIMLGDREVFKIPKPDEAETRRENRRIYQMGITFVASQYDREIQNSVSAN